MEETKRYIYHRKPTQNAIEKKIHAKHTQNGSKLTIEEQYPSFLTKLLSNFSALDWWITCKGAVAELGVEML